MMTLVKSGIVEFTSVKNCFLCLPASWVEDCSFIDRLQTVVFEVSILNTEDVKKIYASCLSTHNDKQDIVRINGLFGFQIGFNHGDRVIVKECSDNVINAKKVCVEPETIDDWEIIELNTDKVQDRLLDQLRIISVGVTFPFWVENSVCLFLNVRSIEPDCAISRLEHWSEVVVIPNSTHLPAEENVKTETCHQLSSQKSFDRSMSVNDSPTIIDQNMISSSADLARRSKNNSLPDMDDDNAYRDVQKQFLSLPTESSRHAGFLASIMKYFSPAASPSNFSYENPIIQQKSVKYFDEVLTKRVDLVLRVMPVSQKLKSAFSTRSKSFNYVYVTSVAMQKYFPTEGTPRTFIAKLIKLQTRSERMFERLQPYKDVNRKPGNEANSDKCSSVFVRVIVISSFGVQNHVMCSAVLRQQLSLPLTNLVHLQSVTSNPVNISKLSLYPLKQLKSKEEAVLAAFRASVIDTHMSDQPQLFSPGSIIQLRINEEESRCNFITDIVPEYPVQSGNVPFCYPVPTDDYIVELKCYKDLPEQIKFPRKPVPDFEPVGVCLHDIGGVEEHANQCTELLKFHLGLGPLADHLNEPYSLHGNPLISNGGILVNGCKGCGKTTLITALLKDLHKSEACVHVEIIECKQLRGKRVETVRLALERSFCEVVERHPSVLFLDDLDHLISEPTNEQELRGEQEHLKKLAELFLEVLLNPTPPQTKIALIATSLSSHSVNEILVSSRAYYFFREIIDIPQPDKNQRLEMLESLICSKTKIDETSTHLASLEWVAKKTEGYVAADLNTIVDRAIHSACHRQGSCNQLVLTDLDFEVSLDGYYPSTLRDITLNKSGDKTLEDVGGLSDVKTSLTRMLLWPTKYPQLFAKCPLRLHSGTLLYGLPGSGKTLIVGAVAKECQMNFINIKGPELLSKYTGASEQAVRDLFTRAQAAKPCLLFFDEFDAIAPRRGHDSTGVTDRVVNQLLTLMDGVEKFQGIYIVAATSRPDLIDPALLRPGRLDKCIQCHLPNKDDRLEILHCLSRHLSFADDVDLSSVSDRTDYYSGADLHAILFTAQINAVHEQQRNQLAVKNEEKDVTGGGGDKILYLSNLLEGTKDVGKDELNSLKEKLRVIESKYFVPIEDEDSTAARSNYSDPPIITQKNVLDALAKSRPSLSTQERLKYQKIYDSFLHRRGDGMNNSVTSTSVVKRSTLA